ncbi:hypothetical protein AJ80_05342 [Polytolypa hystricis UAMH7299]|uniref:C2H2-type domain-containing protein n=1 Tax=Polytolypa hystricis (strain UAMH7299) TaxID=1447883 RepID=A0A2B7Y4C6_POLH7|nr:hypothetical protein AJ80_05342 [Polytolypa hystricis UAMH7299]
MSVTGESSSGYDTELTDPGAGPPRKRPRRGGRGSMPTPAQKEGAREPVGLHHWQEQYEDPADDTDEDLAKVPADFGGSKNTALLRERVEDRWKRYCAAKASNSGTDAKWDDPEVALCQASANDVHRFFNWTLGKLERGKNGRRLKGIRTTGALEADWKYFQGYYKKVTKSQVGKEMSDEVRLGMRWLADKYSLNDQVRQNVPVYIEDMVPFNETVLQTLEKRFHLGLQRLLLCFFNMLGTFTVNRESAILNLQYKDLLLSVQRNPHGGPPVPCVDFKPEFVKKHLGMKKLNTFILPEIIYGISLVYSPHVFLFGFLFHARAFENSRLQSMEDVRRLFPEDGCQEMQLPLKREMDNYYIFCKVGTVGGKVRILRDTPMSSGTLDSQQKSASEIHGLENPLYAHEFRYGGGKMLDESGFVSQAQMNVIMNHANSSTFLKYYRIRRHAGLQEVMCGLDPDKEFDRALTSASRWRDRRRPRYLTDAEKASVEQNPELQAVISVRERLADLYGRTRDPALIPVLRSQQREVMNTRQRLQYKLRLKVRGDFSRNQAVLDIDRQLSGVTANDNGSQQQPRIEFEMPPAQIHLLDKLLALPKSDSLEDEWRRRNEAVEAVRQYCGFLEGGPLRGRPKRSRSPDEAFPDDASPEKIRQEEERQPIDERAQPKPKPLDCFQCGRLYSDHQGVRRHFRSAHLNDRRCGPCGLSLPSEMHLRSHAAKTHSLRT